MTSPTTLDSQEVPPQAHSSSGMAISHRHFLSSRMQHLADTIRDTARLARAVLTLLLLLSLYLLLTLVASTDENILLNGQVALPELGVGFSLYLSYIAAPAIFVYLHVQLMYILIILAKKLYSYKYTIHEVSPQADSGEDHTILDKHLAHDYLPALPFVQMFFPGFTTTHVSRLLVWIGIFIVPLFLLMGINLSFIRYQSTTVTCFHHSLLILDYIFVLYFFRQVRGPYPKVSKVTLLHTVILRSLRRAVGPIRAKPVTRSLSFLMRLPIPLMLLLVLLHGHPPRFDIATLNEDRQRIWGEAEEGIWSALISGQNLMDAGPCSAWGIFCRFISVRAGPAIHSHGAALVSASTVPQNGDWEGPIIDLAGRNFRFAKLHFVNMTGGDLRHAVLEGADLTGSNLSIADLSGGRLEGAILKRSRLQGTTLLRAKLNGANLEEAMMQGANLSFGQLVGANLSFAQLAGADFQLAYLQGANFSGAGLQGVNFEAANLMGANLSFAKLHGASLVSAKLQAAHLGLAVLEGTSMVRASLGYNSGFPGSMFLAILDNVVLHDNGYGDLHGYVEETLIEGLPQRGLADVKVESGVETLREHFSKKIGVESQSVHLASRWAIQVLAQSNENLVAHDQNDWQNHRRYETDGDEFWRTLVSWSVDFACRNRFVALATLRRWQYADQMDGFSIPSAFWLDLRKELREARQRQQGCYGIVALPENVWERYGIEWS